MTTDRPLFRLEQVNGADLKPGHVVMVEGYAWEVLSVALGTFEPRIGERRERYNVTARWVDRDGRGCPGGNYARPDGINFGLRVDLLWTRRVEG